MHLICDNWATLYITSNSVCYERSKHIKVECHFIREKLQFGDITTGVVKFSEYVLLKILLFIPVSFLYY